MGPMFTFERPEIPTSLRAHYQSWEAGFDAATDLELTGQPAVCPFFGKQATLWRAGFAASRRVTELASEL